MENCFFRDKYYFSYFLQLNITFVTLLIFSLIFLKILRLVLIIKDLLIKSVQILC